MTSTSVAALHVGIPVSDMERALWFYRDLLGLTFISSREVSGERVSMGVGVPNAHIRIVLLDAGTIQLELLHYLNPPGRPFSGRNNDVGSMHVAFKVADLQGVYDRLQAAGIACNTAPLRSTYPEGWGWFYARDPDGMTVELSGPLAAP